MGYGSRAFLAGGLGFAVAFAAACGSTNGLLSSDQSSSLADQLQTVSSAVAAHQCGQAASAGAALTNAVVNLPPSVNHTLSQNLAQGAGTVSQLAVKDCSATTTTHTTPTTTATATTTVTSPTTTTPTTTTTTTTPTTTSPTTPPATNPAPPGTSTNNGGTPIGPGGTATAGNGGSGQ